MQNQIQGNLSQVNYFNEEIEEIALNIPNYVEDKEFRKFLEDFGEY